MEHPNPLRKIAASPVIRRSTPAQPSTPGRRRGYSVRHSHQISNTRSPQDLACNFRQREDIQEEILRMLEENSRMMGVLTDFDYEIRQRAEQIDQARCQYYRQASGAPLPDHGETPVMRELRIIRSKLNAIDIRRSVHSTHNA